MTFLHFLFYLFAFLATISAFMVIFSRNTVQAVLFLVMTFVSTAGIWLMLNAEFLALILVLVYVGAVMTLFLFVVMMLNLDFEHLKEKFVRYLPLGALIVLVLVGLIAMVTGPDRLGLMNVPAPAPKPADYSNTADLGSILYTDYAYPFEIAAVLLLTAIVAAISLTHRKTTNKKAQRIEAQIAVTRSSRVRLVKMKSEKRNKL